MGRSMVKRKYYRVRLGTKNTLATKCFDECIIGSDLVTSSDLSTQLHYSKDGFRKKFEALDHHCNMLYNMFKKIKIGDIVLCKDEADLFRIGKITGDYIYVKGGEIPHTRAVTWIRLSISRAEVGEKLYNAFGTGPMGQIDKYAQNIESLI